MSENLAYNAQVGIVTKTFLSPLTSYTQANCQISLTDTGYRIYRPPNKTVSADGNTMWGGFVLRYFTPPFIKGHTYIIIFDVKGQSSNGVSSEMYWSNNCGWGGGGLNPAPSNVQYQGLSANFQSTDWVSVYYKWTINDDIYKTCTSSYSSFVQGTIYPSYRDFKFGFGYTDTGTLGTDLYINNIRMYDLTNSNNLSINDKGQILTTGVIETSNQLTSFIKSQDIKTNIFYEY